MDAQHLTNIEQSYDRVASEYARRISGELAHKPFDRELLDRFATRLKSQGPVCDVGCGPGHVAAYLHERGVQVEGVDLSPAMIDQARTLYPTIPYRQGNLLAFDSQPDSFAGIVAFYSLVHVPRSDLPVALRELWRILRPGGLLLVAFHTGQADVHFDELWGLPVALDFLFFNAAEIESELRAAGFTIEESVERAPYPEVEAQTQRVYILACKPDRS